MQPSITLARRTVYAQPPFLLLELHTVQLPDGRLIDDWPWVVTPDFVNIVPITAGGHFLCFRQPKYGIEGLSLAAIGGYFQPGEAPLNGAQRELEEETGYEADEWAVLGQYRVDANRGAGNAHFFVARGLHHVAEPDSDDLEPQQLLELSPADVSRALAEGEFKVLSWAAVMALALRQL